MYCIFFIHSSLEGHIGVHFFAIMNRVTMNTAEEVSLWQDECMCSWILMLNVINEQSLLIPVILLLLWWWVCVSPLLIFWVGIIYSLCFPECDYPL